jgi:hypothetical protein
MPEPFRSATAQLANSMFSTVVSAARRAQPNR